jgi:hypothetical protein
MNLNQVPLYNTMTFDNVFIDENSFVDLLKYSGIPLLIKEENAKVLYYLLYAKYGNSPIANTDINQFKYKICSIVFQYGPSWEKRLEIQKNIRELSEDDLLAGSKQIYNTAYNPANEPSTNTNNELQYINNQNVAKVVKNKVDAYRNLWDLLRVDVTEVFLRQFKNLFKMFVTPERVVLYESEE